MKPCDCRGVGCPCEVTPRPAAITLRTGTGTAKSTVEIVGKVHVGFRVTHNRDAKFPYVVARGSDGTFYETKSRGGGYRVAVNQGAARACYEHDHNQAQRR